MNRVPPLAAPSVSLPLGAKLFLRERLYIDASWIIGPGATEASMGTCFSFCRDSAGSNFLRFNSTPSPWCIKYLRPAELHLCRAPNASMGGENGCGHGTLGHK